MVVASRGITYRDRHLMNNLKTMLPHSKSGKALYDCKVYQNSNIHFFH